MITFVICIKVASEVSLEILSTQLASCMAVQGARVFIGLSTNDSRLEEGLSALIEGRARGRCTLAILHDRSLYDAWNIAVASACSERVVFLGYGDVVICPTFFSDQRDSTCDVMFSRVLIHGLGKARMFGRPFRPWRHLLAQEVAIVGAIFSRALLLKKPFDADFRIVGDYDWLLRNGRHVRTGYSRTVSVAMPAGGLSERNGAIRRNELRRARKRLLLGRK